MSQRHPIVRGLKSVGNLIAVILVVPSTGTSWLEAKLAPKSEVVFAFWAHAYAFLPGLPGIYLRRAFYYGTLTSCSLDCAIGVGAFFSHRTAHVEDHVYIGPYAVIGCARIRHGSLIGTRVSLLSGANQHQMSEDGRWTASEPNYREIEIGPNAWIGEGAVVMADVGAGGVVAAGAVVATAVPEGIVVAGNPARFVRKSRE